MRVLFANLPAETTVGDWSRIVVRAGSRWPFAYHQKTKRQQLYYAPFPLALATAAAVMRERGHTVSALDSLPLRLSREAFFAAAEKFRPELIFFETAALAVAQDLEMAAELQRRTGARIAALGAQATATAGRLLEQSAIDYVLRGEYERTAGELADRVEKRRTQRGSGIRGLAGRDEDGAYFEEGLGEIPDPNVLPTPAYDLFPRPHQDRKLLALYRDNIAPEKFCLQTSASRGCNRRCSFCLWNQVLSPGLGRRARAPAAVAEEIARLQETWEPDSFYFDDDSFTGDPTQAEAVCRELLRLKKRPRWYAMADLDGLEPDLLGMMAQAGCRGLKFGVESAADGVLKPEGKQARPVRAAKTVAAARRRGIRTHATFCLGLPGESPESLAATLALAQGLSCDSIQCSICIPYPGTELRRRLRREKRLLSEDQDRCDGSRSLIAFPELEPGRIEEARRLLLRRWLRSRLREPRWAAGMAKYLIRRGRALGPRGLADWLGVLRDAYGGRR